MGYAARLFRCPKTTAERRATAVFLSSEDGHAVAIRARRRPKSLPDAWDDVPLNTSRFDSSAKIRRLERRRQARKFKQHIRAFLASAVEQEQAMREAVYDF